MENSTSPSYGGDIVSQYPPATEQPEEEYTFQDRPEDVMADKSENQGRKQPFGRCSRS